MENHEVSDGRKINIKVYDRAENYIGLQLIAICEYGFIRGSAIISKKDIGKSINFCKSFPLTEGGVIFSGGKWSDDGIRVDVENIHASIHILDQSGRLMLRIKLFEEDFDYHDRGFGCGGTFDYHLSYSGLSDFLNGIDLLCLGQRDEFEFINFTDW